MNIKEKLNDDLNHYNRVILVNSSFEYRSRVVEILSSFADIKVYIAEKLDVKHSNIDIISNQDEKDILDLYYLYDFSEKFTVIEKSNQYGNVWNYVDTGVLEVDDAIRSYVI